MTILEKLKQAFPNTPLHRVSNKPEFCPDSLGIQTNCGDFESCAECWNREIDDETDCGAKMDGAMTKKEERELHDACYECTGYGDDYHFDDEGNLVSSCDTCWVKKRWDEEEENNETD